MVAAGYVGSIREAFDRYIGRGKPAYIKRERQTPAEAIQLVRAAGGLPVLAHPLEYPDIESRLPELIDAGLAGIECYYGEYSPEQRQQLAAIATQHGLLATGGSDYHGFPMGDATEVANEPGSVYVPDDTVERLRARAARRAASAGAE